MTLTTTQSQQVSGTFMDFIASIYDGAAQVTPGTGGKFFGAHGMAFGAMGEVLSSGGAANFSTPAFVLKMTTADLIFTAGAALGGSAVAFMGLTLAPPILFGAAVAGAFGSGLLANSAVEAYQDWLGNNGPQRLSDAIDSFADAAYAAGTEMNQALRDMINEFMDNAVEAMNAALDAYISGVETIAEALTPWIIEDRKSVV